MRTAGCAALMEAVVRNNGAHDRDNRQGGEEGPGKCKDKKQKKKKQTPTLSNRQGNKGRQHTKVTKLSGMCSLRAWLAFETANFPLKPSQPLCN